MAWTLKGSYAETCSCELMCPCNLSFDHGATYDFCRATLAFHVREGEVDDTDVAGAVEDGGAVPAVDGGRHSSITVPSVAARAPRRRRSWRG